MRGKLIVFTVGLLCVTPPMVGLADEAMQRKMQPVMEKYQARRRQVEAECRAKMEQLRREEETEMKRLMTEEERAQFERMIPRPVTSPSAGAGNAGALPSAAVTGRGMKTEQQQHFDRAQHEFDQMKQHRDQFEQMMNEHDPQTDKKRKAR